jgi:eukaryotic-like serine/threonine-protein kinase
MPEVHTNLPVGTLLRERYLIKNVLGSGIAGTVYLAKDQQAKNIKYQLFALKEIGGLDQQDRYQLTFNGAALRQLQHPALPHIHHIFNDDRRGYVYLVMDYVEGTNLETLRQQQPARRLSWSELRTICEPLAAALTYLHLQEKPLFHGDLAPTNAIQGIAGKVMFLDLGYAQAVMTEGSKLTASATSTSYHAPEQLTGELDAILDVYGLGALLYELLTGQAPVDALTRLERVNKKKADPLTVASKVTPDVHRPLAETLQKALALDPAERFQSIREFWQTLSALPVIDQDATPVANKQGTPGAGTANPAGVALPTPIGSASNASPAKSGKRRPALLPTVAALCALLLLVAGLGTWAWVSAHSPGKPRTGATSGQQGTATPGRLTPAPGSGKSLSLLGTYKGRFNFPEPSILFTLIISQQQSQGQISGEFYSSLLNGSITGTTDFANDVQWTVIDASGHAALIFSGGFNGGFNGTNLKKNDNMAGYFFKCTPNQGPTCGSQESGPGSGGSWTVSYFSSSLSVFRGGAPAWS